MTGMTATSRVIATVQKNAPMQSPGTSPLSRTMPNGRLCVFAKISYRITVGIRKIMEITMPNNTLRELFKGDPRFRKYFVRLRGLSQTVVINIIPIIKESTKPIIRKLLKNEPFKMFRVWSNDKIFCSFAFADCNNETGNRSDNFSGRSLQVSLLLNPVQYLPVPRLQFEGIASPKVVEITVLTAPAALWVMLATGGIATFISFVRDFNC